MQKIVEIKDFDSFIMERKENNVKRDKFKDICFKT